MNIYVGYAGCKVNQFEKSLIEEKLIEAGYLCAAAPDDADIIIYNTCCVTKNAESGCRQAIRKFNKVNPGAKIIVTGCYGERAKDELLKLPGIVRVVGNAEKNAIAEIIKQNLLLSKRVSGCPERTLSRQGSTVFCESKSSAAGWERTKPLERSERVREGHPDALYKSKNPTKSILTFEFTRTVKDRARALLKIQDGCDAFCSYCIVPYVRGKPVSMQEELVMKNLWNLKDENEVVLTGIHLGKWGVDNGKTFANLMRRIANEKFPYRVRLSSLEPFEITEKLLQTLKGMDNFCPHFHIPLQSGSDGILKLMRRNYTTADFVKLIDLIRRHFPLSGIGIDVIVGFPGEQEKDFEETHRLLENFDVDYMHIFQFSPREGTPACSMNPKVPGETSKTRAAILKKLDEKKRQRFSEKFLNRTVKCVADKKEKNLYRAVTREYLKVYLDADPGEKEFEAEVVATEAMGTKAVLMSTVSK